MDQLTVSKAEATLNEAASLSVCCEPTPSPMDVETDEVCWICLDEEKSGCSSVLISPCQCPRKVHPKCLARWQLQQAGRSEETTCRFCHCTLEDWKASLTPDNLKPEVQKVQPIMVVYFEGEIHRIPVKQGGDGLQDFTSRIRELFRLPEDVDISLTFGCKEPMSGQHLKLEGIGAFDAAVHCASVAAADRQHKLRTISGGGDRGDGSGSGSGAAHPTHLPLRRTATAPHSADGGPASRHNFHSRIPSTTSAPLDFLQDLQPPLSPSGSAPPGIGMSAPSSPTGLPPRPQSPDFAQRRSRTANARSGSPGVGSGGSDHADTAPAPATAAAAAAAALQNLPCGLPPCARPAVSTFMLGFSPSTNGAGDSGIPPLTSPFASAMSTAAPANFAPTGPSTPGMLLASPRSMFNSLTRSRRTVMNGAPRAANAHSRSQFSPPQSPTHSAVHRRAPQMQQVPPLQHLLSFQERTILAPSSPSPSAPSRPRTHLPAAQEQQLSQLFGSCVSDVTPGATVAGAEARAVRSSARRTRRATQHACDGCVSSNNSQGGVDETPCSPAGSSGDNSGSNGLTDRLRCSFKAFSRKVARSLTFKPATAPGNARFSACGARTAEPAHMSMP